MRFDDHGWFFWIPFALLLTSIGAVAGAEPPGGIAPETGRDQPVPRYAPGQLLVQFRDSLEAPAESVVGAGVTFAEALSDPSSSLDDLLHQFGARDFEPIMRPAVDAREGEPVALSAMQRSRDRAVRDRFPQRSARAAPGLTLPARHHVYLLHIDRTADIEAAAAAFAADPHVAYAEPNRLLALDVLPNDPYVDPERSGAWHSGSWGRDYSDQWGLETIRWEDVWTRRAEIWGLPAQRGGGGVRVGIVDSGVDVQHPDLAAGVWRDDAGRPGFDAVDIDLDAYLELGLATVEGEDYREPDFDPADRNGHGTHVAGIVGARANNGEGIAGVAWRSLVMPLRAGFSILRQDGRRLGLLETDDIVRAIEYGVEHGVDVLNMSFGGEGSETLAIAVETARASGVVLVAAAGNANADARKHFPASLPGVLSVGALDAFGRRAAFSNWGPGVDVAAPGVDVLSLRSSGTALTPNLVGEGYVRASGTSMASPHVAGVAALVLSGSGTRALNVVGRIVAHSQPRSETVERRNEKTGETMYWRLGGGALSALDPITGPRRPGLALLGYGIGGDENENGSAEPGESAQLRLVVRNAWYRLQDTTLRLSSLQGGVEPLVTQGTLNRWRHDSVLDVRVPIRVASDVGWGEADDLLFEARSTQDPGQPWLTLPFSVDLHTARIKSGWPASGADVDTNSGSPALGDLNGDGSLESIFFTEQGHLLALDPDGLLLPGWPVLLPEGQRFGSPNVGDVDGDGRMEVAVGVVSGDPTEDSLYLLDAEGTVLPGWPRPISRTPRSTPAFGDLDSDGDLEILISSSGGVAAFHHSGEPVTGWPIPMSTGFAPVTVAHLDDTGARVLVAESENRGLAAFTGTGVPAAGRWPAQGPAGRTGPAVVDLDGDGLLEVVLVDRTNQLVVLDRHAEVRLRTPVPGLEAALSPVAGDLDGDGRPEIVVAGHEAGRGFLAGFDAEGTLLEGWPVAAGGIPVNMALADLDGDGAEEVLLGSHDRAIYALRGNGEAVPSWPFHFVGRIGLVSDLGGGIAVGDLDGDGVQEILVGRSRSGGPGGVAYALEFGEGPIGGAQWTAQRGDAGNTGSSQ